MKARILLVALVVAFTSFATAQEKKKFEKPTPEQRVEFRVKMMQQKLMLDDKKAAEFAPIYKEYITEMAKCRPALERGKDLTDVQIKKNLEARMDARQKALDVEKKCYGKLSKILTARQLQVVFCNDKGFGKADGRKFAPRGKFGGKGKAKNFCKGKKPADCKN